MSDIIDKMNEFYKNHYAFLKTHKSSSLILNYVDLFYDYFEIKTFESTHTYKKISTMIKKYYKYKSANVKKYHSAYDDYVHDRALRAKRVIEIEFLDKSVMYLNPVIRYSGEFPKTLKTAEIDSSATMRLRIVYLVIGLIIAYLFARYRFRKKSNPPNG